MKNLCTILTASSVYACCGLAAAQTSEYFITTENLFPDDIRVIQNGVITRSWVPNIRQGAIAVGQSVFTIDEALGNMGVFPGSEWDLFGAPIGPASLDTTGIVTGRIIDGAFDGQNTYVVSGFDAFGTPVTGGEVWRFGPGFSGVGTLMFTVGQQDQGITYDTSSNTIWTSEYNLSSGSVGMIKQWSLTGTLLSSFPAARPGLPGGPRIESERNTALAYDPADGTLWFNAHVEVNVSGTQGELWQFDRQGNFLQAIDPDPNTDVLYWGGEFAIPGPGALALLAGAGLMTRRRRA